MKQADQTTRRKRVLAAVCALTLLIGSSAGVYAFGADPDTDAHITDSSLQTTHSKSKTAGSVISADGTITASQLSERFGFENTSAKLTVEKVLVETGDTVTSGTKLYRLTADSVAKAKLTLNSELEQALSKLSQQKAQYQSEKIKAYTLCQSDLMLAKTVQQQYDNSVSALDSKLKEAFDSYQQALTTVNSTPSEINSKNAELSAAEKSAEALSQKTRAAQQQTDAARKAYEAAAADYNAAVTDYNSAASVVRYLGSALGKDTSDITLQNSVTTSSAQKASSSGSAAKSAQSESAHGSRSAHSSVNEDISVLPSQKSAQTSQNSSKTTPQSTDPESLYNAALKDYNAKKQELSRMKNTLNAAEKEYDTLSDTQSKLSDELEKANSGISSLEKQITELQSTLSKANSNLTKLRGEYESLNNTYETNKLKLKNKLDTDLAASANAQHNYELTCKTLQSELDKVQAAYDTAVRNAALFEKDLSQGYICAQQDGIIDTLSLTEGKNTGLSSEYVSYVDESDLKTTVRLDQYEVTRVNIGDTAVIYSAETGAANARITAVCAGEAESLAKVSFDVTVTADENSKLYSGQSVSVYFNYESSGSGASAEREGD